MNPIEIPIDFECAGCQLFGVVHRPAVPNRRGVVMLTGGYRCGPHRWFVLQARECARAGFPVMRFSARGTDDSQGIRSKFEGLKPDLTAAIDEFFRLEPGLEEVVLWGVCGRASEVLLYAPTDSRVSAIVLLNLYLDVNLNDDSQPRLSLVALTYLRHLWGRVKTFVFWRRVLFAPATIDWVSSSRRIKRSLLVALRVAPFKSAGLVGPHYLLDQLTKAFREFQGRVLFIFSGRNLEATIPRNLIVSGPWRQFCSSKAVEIRELCGADPTFSRRAWSDQACAWTLEWLRSWR